MFSLKYGKNGEYQESAQFAFWFINRKRLFSHILLINHLFGGIAAIGGAPSKAVLNDKTSLSSRDHLCTEFVCIVGRVRLGSNLTI